MVALDRREVLRGRDERRSPTLGQHRRHVEIPNGRRLDDGRTIARAVVSSNGRRGEPLSAGTVVVPAARPHGRSRSARRRRSEGALVRSPIRFAHPEGRQGSVGVEHVRSAAPEPGHLVVLPIPQETLAARSDAHEWKTTHRLCRVEDHPAGYHSVRTVG
jgi:hypothetical protein